MCQYVLVAFSPFSVTFKTSKITLYYWIELHHEENYEVFLLTVELINPDFLLSDNEFNVLIDLFIML